MKERTYLACDLNNAEKKEMPILSATTERKQKIPDNIGILLVQINRNNCSAREIQFMPLRSVYEFSSKSIEKHF